jgi:WD40 repeat protein
VRGKKEGKAQGRQGRLRVNGNEQGCLVKWCDEVRLNRLEKVETDHSDAILCIYFLNDQYIATGSKDATINIYSLEGRKVRRLKGHEASICCLSSFRNLNGDVFLASGSDHGCSSLILWDIRSWSIQSKIQAHVAAVTAIVDLEDGRHIATGSYDKKIAIYSMIKNQVVLTLNNNKSSVTGMVINADKTRLVTSGLDKTLSVWSIIRKNGVLSALARSSRKWSARRSSTFRTWSASCSRQCCDRSSSSARPGTAV